MASESGSGALRTVLVIECLRPGESPPILIGGKSRQNSAESCILAHGGQVHGKWEGDLWVSFGSAIEAVNAAIAIQRAFAAPGLEPPMPIEHRPRIGAHTGEMAAAFYAGPDDEPFRSAVYLKNCCSGGAIALSGTLLSGLEGRHLPLAIHEMAIDDLSSPSPAFKAFLGILQAVEDSSSRGAQPGRKWIVLAADLGALASQAQVAWEREAMRVASSLGGRWYRAKDGTGFLMAEAGSKALDAMLQEKLEGPRAVLAAGEVLVSDPAERVTILSGKTVEHCLGALRCGGEKPLLIATEEAVSMAGSRRSWEPYGRLGYEGPLLYKSVPGPPFPFYGIPQRITATGRHGLVDFITGAGRGLVPAAGSVMSRIHRLVAEADPVWKSLYPVLSPSQAELLEGDDGCGLAVLLGFLAAGSGSGFDFNVAAAGAVEDEGAIGAGHHLESSLPGFCLVAPPGIMKGEVSIGSVHEALLWVQSLRQEAVNRSLAEASTAGKLVVIISGPFGGADEAPSLAGALEEALGIDPQGKDIAGLAEEMEAGPGRDALLCVFNQWCSSLEASPLPSKLSSLRPARTISLFPDPRLEGSSVKALGGSVSQPVLSEAGFEKILSGLFRMGDRHGELMATHPVLLCSHPLTDMILRIFIKFMRQEVSAGPTMPMALVCPGITAVARHYWERRGVRVLEGSAVEVLDKVACAAGTMPSVSEEPRALAESIAAPYKFLESFEEQDRSIFFGRDGEVPQVRERILSHAVTVVYGRSGVGKTSLLKAGVLPSLPPPQNLSIVIRCIDDPLAAINRSLSQCLLTGAGEASLPDLAGRLLAHLSGSLIILIDQFEEFFVRLTREHQRRFCEEIALAIASVPSRLHVIFSLREDFLASMADLEPWLPGVLDNRYRLGALSDEQARLAIEGPAGLFDVSVEKELADTLINELRGEGVDPPELQIVLDRLYASRNVRSRSMTMESYRALGGVSSILVDYLRRTIADDMRDITGNLPRRLMGAMVTDHGTKAVVTIADIACRVGVPESDAASMMERFVQARIVRSLSDEEGQTLYELVHEYLLSEIRSWATEEDLEVRHGELIVRSELESWQHFGSLISPDRLDLLYKVRLCLSLSADELALVVRASAIHQRPIEGWTHHALFHEAGVPVLLEMLDDPSLDGFIKRAVIESLFPLAISGEALEKILEAAESVGHPALMAKLRESEVAGSRTVLIDEMNARVKRRFTGPRRMAKVEAGPFLFGSTRENRELRKKLLGAHLHHSIDHEADIGEEWLETFYIDLCPVTNEEYAEFRPGHLQRYPPGQDRYPVTRLSWHDARDYAAWLGKELPSAQQWEKAARGPEGRLFPWGNEFSPALLNSAESGLASTTPVGMYPQGASPYGCLDMAGNVWEWTCSEYEGKGPLKVQKGGSFADYEPQQQASSLQDGHPDFIILLVGFRTVSTGNMAGQGHFML
ncbi:MAG: SUMF1/EgtB/PvdO family nonheme iron enzyme [Candidatus Eremiobacteraeota bacterium]|nr:SUMF1/EgtB/PvdO family nonheme iron enzyme [Candidatus Eremiobacteraeota bacterium]